MMQPIRVMIVEDMQLIAEDIAVKLKRNNMAVTGIYPSGEEAIEAVAADKPDLILMDIHLAGAYDGIAAAKLILDQHPAPIIYLSDFVDQPTVARATKTHPSAYLSKPFQEPDLIRAIQIAFENFNDNKERTGILKDHIFLKDKEMLVKVPYEEIVCIEADRSYCKVVTEERTLVQTVSMNHVVDQIGHRDFVKVHRSHVINIRKVTGIDGNMLRLGNRSVEMSRAFRDGVIARLNIL